MLNLLLPEGMNLTPKSRIKIFHRNRERIFPPPGRNVDSHPPGSHRIHFWSPEGVFGHCPKPVHSVHPKLGFSQKNVVLKRILRFGQGPLTIS